MDPAATLDRFCADLKPRLDGDLRRDDVTRALYATDASLYQKMPLAVVLPRSVADVQAALRCAAAHGLPVLPRGGGTSLAGQAVAEAVVIDFSRYMHRILEIDAAAGWARVEPGVVLDDLNRAAAEHGLVFGPDPAPSNRCTLGGMMANNATGTHSILYGNFIHHIQRAEGLLADGTPLTMEPLSPEAWAARQEAGGAEGDLYRALDALLKEKGEVVARDTPRHWRRNSGYRLEHLLDGGLHGDSSHEGDGAAPRYEPAVIRAERQGQAAHQRGALAEGAETQIADAPAAPPRNLAQLLCGSEGTLAVATELTVRLARKPRQTAVAVVHYETRDEALRSVTTILDTEPAAVELFDGAAIERVRRTPGFAHRLTFVEGDPGGVLITEYFGDTAEELDAKLEALDAALAAAGESTAVVRRRDEAAIQNVWGIRKEALGLIMGVKGDFKPVAFVEDTSVPAEHLADYIDELAALIESTDTKAVFYAHASAGTLHVRPFINTKTEAGVAAMETIAHGSMELVAKYGGVVSSEHGDGRARGWLNDELLGPDLMAVYRRLKDIFDPEGRLNPGVIVDAPPMRADLRLGPDYATIPVLTEMDFSDDGGFAGAVELCNGNGACRKLESGTMCPSYMATREEEHSTRGRANALRMAMSGGLSEDEFTSERMYEVMDLCIQCKACKTECPSNVDMGKIKTEWLAKYWQKNPMPLRSKLFARLPTISRRVAGTPMARVANGANRLGPLRALMARTVGISAERDLPPFATETFAQWFAKQEWPQDGPPVVLFADTFTGFHTPAVAKAAAEFLRGAGCAVRLPDESVCCGRTLLSKGLVTEAQQQALQAVEALHVHAAAGTPIVGLEPSCISAFTDDFAALLPGDPRAKAVAQHALLFEDFVAQRAEGGDLDDVRWTDAKRDVLLHGHCHQKALVGTGGAEAALSLPPGYRVRTVDSGCCGMAGAFGYEEEHIEVSKKMAERRLAPAVRAAGEDTIIAAPGFSCRSQIKDLTGRTAQHPAEILRAALA